MQTICYFVGLDVHKQVIAYCVKKADGEIVMEGKVKATRSALSEWVKTLPGPWRGGMEATMFSHWIYRYLQPYALELRMGHPARMKAITSGKKKSDKIDARTIADLLRANLFPACFVTPLELEGLRRQMRYRRLVVQETVRFKNKTAGLLMEVGAEYEGRRLHGKRYFGELMKSNPAISEELRPLLEFNRSQIEGLVKMDQRLTRMLESHGRLRARVEALQKIDGVGPVTSLTWALEVGDPKRFGSIKEAVSYCGLASALRESAGQQKRGPLSKQRNPHLQSMLIEAAKMAPRAERQAGPSASAVERTGAQESGHGDGGAQAGGLSARCGPRLLRCPSRVEASRLRVAFLEACRSIQVKDRTIFPLPVKRRRALVATNPPRNSRPDSSE